MDTSLKELSLHVYSGFGCYDDTCTTVQIARRTWNCLMNHLANVGLHCKHLGVGAGSMHEGTSICVMSKYFGESDKDMMLVDPWLQLYPIGYNGDYDGTKCCLQMKTSEHTRPGYCLVEVVGKTQIDLDLYIAQLQNGFHEYARRQFKSKFSNSLFNPSENAGPAVTFIDTLITPKTRTDGVICFASKLWPAECRKWSDQIKWPSVTLQESVKREGFHIVRVGHALSSEMNTEWRMSFSVAEKMLIHSFNPTQLTCAVVMKLFLNHFIKPKVTNSLSSYHIKTLMLWSVEQDIDQIWEPQYFIQCLEKLLSNLMKCISVGKLQHYFIPDNNLFECKITEDNKGILFQEVETLQLTVAFICISLLRVISIDTSPSEAYILQAHSLKKIAFKFFHHTKYFVASHVLQSISMAIQAIAEAFVNKSYHAYRRIIIENISNFTNLNKEGYERLSEKCFSYFQASSGSLSIAFCNSPIREIKTEGNEINWRILCAFHGLCVLDKSYETASTTGCIKMALVHMCQGNHYHAVPLLNRALNIIDQFDNYNLYQNNEEPPNEYHFTEYMHLYNDQQAIERELLTEFLNDKVLCETPFIWLEMSLLPLLLQLELTQNFYNIDILSSLDDAMYFMKIQYWNPIPQTHFLLFICHYELLKSVTFLDPASLHEDIRQLRSLIHDRQRLKQDEVPPLLNLLAWCYLKIGNTKLMVKHAVNTVQQSTDCEKNLFSHLFIQHIIDTVIEQDKRCIIS